MTKFNLSERLAGCEENGGYYEPEDVKEFIRLLKENVKREADNFLQKDGLSLENYHGELPFINFIDKIAGDKLNGKE